MGVIPIHMPPEVNFKKLRVLVGLGYTKAQVRAGYANFHITEEKGHAAIQWLLDHKCIHATSSAPNVRIGWQDLNDIDKLSMISLYMVYKGAEQE